MYSSINASSNRKSMRRRLPVKHAHVVHIPVEDSVQVNLSKKDRILDCCRILYHCVRRVIFGVSDGYDGDFDEFDVQVVHFKPSNLDDLCRNTYYTREEIKMIYRGFKQECPAGVVNAEQFKELYSQFYPLGDAGLYASYVFATFDQDEDGHLTFDQFISGMSLLARGSQAQKLRWIYNLYDLNGTGRVTRSNIRDIWTAMNQMLGTHARPGFDDLSRNEEVNRIFSKLDLNGDGVISFAEFLEACQSDPHICASMDRLSTVLA